MSADDEVTITVRRDDLCMVLQEASGTDASDRIKAAIPWEPNEEQIAAYRSGLSHTTWADARRHLIFLYGAGLRLP